MHKVKDEFVLGERALWRAVIHQAARDGLRYKGTQRIYGEAYNWFKENRAQFRFVCELSNLEPDVVRTWFLKAYEAQHGVGAPDTLVVDENTIESALEDFIESATNTTPDSFNEEEVKDDE